jgi:hypothetical protein
VKIHFAIGHSVEPRVAKPRDEGFDALLKQAKQPAAPAASRSPQLAKAAPADDNASIDTSVDTPVDVAVGKPDAPSQILAAPANDAPPSLLTAIAHAIAALRGTPTQAAAPTVAIEAPAEEAAIAEPGLTPLEQAVHDMLAELAPVHTRDAEPHEEHEAHDEPADAPAPANTNAPIAPAPAHIDAPRTTHTAAPPPSVACEIAAEMPVAQSHVHLIVGDDAERVVVTVAVRGNDVNVALRAGDEHTAAALARNADALDHALRTRGLDLASFSAERDPDRRRREQPHRERQPEPQQPFVLEQP